MSTMLLLTATLAVRLRRSIVSVLRSFTSGTQRLVMIAKRYGQLMQYAWVCRLEKERKAKVVGHHGKQCA